MKYLFSLAIVVLLSMHLLAQNNALPSYQSANNKHYWKNNPPVEGYWQQDVSYTINATLNPDSSTVGGTLTLKYTNNSPDELTHVYFHLYQNAFQPGSYAHQLALANGVKHRFGPHERQGKGTVIHQISEGGAQLETTLDNTILKAIPSKPIEPGSTVTFSISFTTYFDQGSMRRRMKKFQSRANTTHFDGVHWYPRIAVYDRKFGWTTDQHLGKEFYGDFGTFDVKLTFPHHYIVDATGELQNEEEVLPKNLRDKIAISNFKDKPWGEPASEIIKPIAGKTKTWHFKAKNVHDFAFTADPTYRMETKEWNGVKAVALVQESHASGWQDAASIAIDVIKTFSEDFGMYEYPKIIVADARDGMEYPMLTLDGGASPEYVSLLAHEIGHNWFFGMLGNNETYRAAMDEGFTQFLTAWYMTKWDSLNPIEPTTYGGKHREKHEEPYKSVYYGYYAHTLNGNDAKLNTHSDDFSSALGHGGGYGLVYYKQATMLYNLQYVLGDSLFLAAMKHYVAQWKMAHPYPEDFRNSVIRFTGVDLNWFFDQWLETEKYIDYAVKKVKRISDSSYAITFERKGTMQMPIDFTVRTANNKTLKYHIPNTWFEKQETDVTSTNRWIGWGKLNTEHTVVITPNEEIIAVEIDPTKRLADINQLNNQNAIPVSITFNKFVASRPAIDKYEVKFSPDLWYNSFDGVKLGMRLQGSYMNNRHKTDLRVWANTEMFQHAVDMAYPEKRRTDLTSYTLSYSTPLQPNNLKNSIFLNSQFVAGQLVNEAGLKHVFDNEKTSLSTSLKSLYRHNGHSDNYLIYYTQWRAKSWNNSINLRLEHKYKYFRGTGHIDAKLRSTAFGDAEYSYANITTKNSLRLWRFTLKQRAFAQYGRGTNWAPESQLYAWGANPEEMSNSKYYRAVTVLPREFTDFGTTPNQYQMGGGLNLRGYSGYFAPELDENGFLQSAYKGHSGVALNTEIEFQKLLPLRMPKITRYVGLKTYFFGDAGILFYESLSNKFTTSAVRADAGVGTELIIKKFGPFETFKPLSIRFDMPLFLNRLPAGESEYFAFRWLLGVQRCF